MQEGTDTVFVSQGGQDLITSGRATSCISSLSTLFHLWTRHSIVAVGMGRDFFVRNAEELSNPNITPARRQELLRYMAEGHPDRHGRRRTCLARWFKLWY